MKLKKLKKINHSKVLLIIINQKYLRTQINCLQDAYRHTVAGEGRPPRGAAADRLAAVHVLCKYRKSLHIQVGWSCLACAGGSASAERSVYLRTLSVRLEKVGGLETTPSKPYDAPLFFVARASLIEA